MRTPNLGCKRPIGSNPMTSISDYVYRSRKAEISSRLSNGRFTDAARMLADLEKAEQNDADVYRLKALLSDMLERIPDAICNYERSLSLQPDYEIAIRLAEIHEALGDFVTAISADASR